MKLYDLGHVPWIQSQLIYHAMPRLGMGGIPAEKLATLEKALIGVKLNEVESSIAAFTKPRASSPLALRLRTWPGP